MATTPRGSVDVDDDTPPEGPAEPIMSADPIMSSEEGIDIIDNDKEVLKERLWKSDELIRQLKHVIKAQHAKIEQLRESIDTGTSGHVLLLLAEQEKTNIEKLRAESEKLRKRVNVLEAEAVKHRAQSDTMRKANRRLKAMLSQEGIAGPGPGCPSLVAKVPGTIEGATNAEAPLLPPAGRLKSVQRQWVNSPRACTADSLSDRGCSSGALPSFSRLSKLIGLAPTLLRQCDTPIAVLHRLIESCNRLLGDAPPATVTAYMLDPWLRSHAEGNNQSTVFYLGQSGTTVQALVPDGQRAELPRFPDLQVLPMRTRTALFIAIETPTTHRRLAVLQALCADEHRDVHIKSPKSRKHAGEFMSAEEPAAFFSDSQFQFLQIACCMAAGALEQFERVEQLNRGLDRMRQCTDIFVAVNKARSLTDFEQRLKHLLSSFFDVKVVRVLFLNPDTEELLVSSAQSRRKGCTSFSLSKGIVGLCAKKRQMIHLVDISLHHNVDAAADGLRQGSRSVAADASMLCGPLAVDSDDGSRLVGVVELLERSKKKGATVTPPNGGGGGEVERGFPQEEQTLFLQILRVCAHAAWRTYLVQDQRAQLAGTPLTLAQMISG
eukprot:NODE_4081_length_1939_cov_4.811258.p1 GENE.NODE_4081_length_1939_cov_4.811258~~NODE_4081_length_1939_cov_4.811258.p1  ORF type:complete len:624 (-),score=187.75 NODE_4081_length_1939_cov_4.811258:68-1885(-)